MIKIITYFIFKIYYVVKETKLIPHGHDKLLLKTYLNVDC